MATSSLQRLPAPPVSLSFHPAVTHEKDPERCEPPSLEAASVFQRWLCLVLCADEDICKLYCIAEDFDFFFAMSSKVKDGTPCSSSDTNVCIEGVCEVPWFTLSTGSGVKMLNLISFKHRVKEKAHDKHSKGEFLGVIFLYYCKIKTNITRPGHCSSNHDAVWLSVMQINYKYKYRQRQNKCLDLELCTTCVHVCSLGNMFRV